MTPDERDALILELRRADLKQTTIAWLVGRSAATVSRILTRLGDPAGRVITGHRSPEVRFWSYVQEQSDGCWQWTGALNRGYGVFHPEAGRQSGRHVTASAHRWAYRHLVGEIPAGLQLDHLCRNRACVNPYHLDPVTSLVNVRRGEPATKTQCVHGHAYTPENTVWKANGRRGCRICRDARNAYWNGLRSAACHAAHEAQKAAA